MNTILKSKITDKCAWVGSEIAQQTDWIYHLSPHMLNVLDQALGTLKAKNLNAPEFEKQDALIEDADFLAQVEYISNELENGYGFIVIRGLDATKYSETQLANIYYLLGLHMGNAVTQNARGDLLGYVENVGDKSKKMTRVYETNDYLPYHADLSDVVGLLSIRKAKQGGLSSIVSSSTVYNRILEQYPEYLGYFYHPAWYDHLGEVDPSLSPIFSYYDGKLACRYLRHYIELGHERRNVPLSQVQIDALNLFDQISHDPSLRLDMMLEPGDIQFCNNYCVMHSRSSFEDYDEVDKRRKLLRLWLKMPNARQLAKDFPGRNGIPKGLGEAA
ncbi:TauD/TfdA family dioxygenase [Acinetobacter bereziniae]|uniref:TauD/TfdA family dioxygenase n=1 Tax=Acinetobacter TaxID=469 RepID=UPI00157FBE5E|nr:TauD/TfdA family dioxygenase [Acinetobacter bereziniae]NUF65110.1 TauD/TfdA family dioxygenase [Acinetobacter bereziniae]NUG09527.1 TauD/TfdA family dioxygenase [Acinetobacter bereziniae]NUG65805.1 TauD/TfdA family dioxygenase [Acinetobacter bereziniae]NUG81906.1 TauD/TfdA family dioxygenase [Acinetobacter bereziniae]